MDIYTRKGPHGRRIMRFSKLLFNNRQAYTNHHQPCIELSANGQDDITYTICLTDSDITNIVESREYHIAQGNWPKKD